ncbi:hypothetical protein FNV43_RR19054 [Rhamnella rubrinervis]|uniref:Uncharacterized protein n=1 Tax=Rhamnella rubrinervis TaxID=2594499 RepID=A0A8K0E4X5_9ROSA|nr:hypothetical protein FNV43_RR19054 [Rhamnella rubrinervis]
MTSASLLKSASGLHKSEWVKGQSLHQPSVSVIRCHPITTSALSMRASSYADELIKTAMWLHAHFHEINPPIVEIANVPFGQRILQAGLVMHTAQECFTFFYNCKGRPQHVYHRSLLSRDYNSNSFFTIPSDVPYDSDDDTATISQAIKKRRTTTSNTTGPISNLVARTMTVDDSTPSHAIIQVQEDPTIPSPTNLDATLSVLANTSVDVSHEIDPHPIVTIDLPLTEIEMPFNSHLIIEDITEPEHNSDVDNFLIDHGPTQNSDCELALTNNSELHTAEVVEPHVFVDLENFFNQNPSPQVINTQLVQSDKKKINAAKKVLLEMVGTGFDISAISKFLHSLDEELATFNKFREKIFDAASHHSSMISLQTFIQSKASEYTTASAKLTAHEHVVKELKAKLAEAKDVCGNLHRSIQHTIDEAEKEKKQCINLLNASKNRDEARIQAEVAITAHHASWGVMNNSIINYFIV